jgi:hypothetical protein
LLVPSPQRPRQPRRRRQPLDEPPVHGLGSGRTAGTTQAPRGEVVGRDEAADLDAPVDPGDSTYRAARCRAGPAATTCSHPRAGTPAIAFSTLRTSRPSRNQRVALNATDKPAAPDGRPLKREGAVIVLAPRQRLWLRNDELVARR